MKNVFKLVFTVALAALIGFSLIACGNNNPLDGIWGNDEEIYIFEGGNYTYLIYGMFLLAEGTYSINGTSVTSQVTRLHANGLNILFTNTLEDIFFGDWLTADDLINNLEHAMTEGWLDDDEVEIIAGLLDELFEPITTTFSISGNTLTFTYDTGNVSIFTRQTESPLD